MGLLEELIVDFTPRHPVTWMNLFRNSLSAMLPQPDFRGQRQNLTPFNPDDSWLSIEIGLKRHAFRRDLPCCRAFVLLLRDDNNEAKKELELKWSGETKSGLLETTLIHGVPRYIPIVIRRHNSDRAVFTCVNWFQTNMSSDSFPNQKPLHECEPGKHSLKLKIKSGLKEFISPVIYTLHVPKEGNSNSQFHIERSGQP